MLELLNNYKEYFENVGLLMPSFLADVVPHKVSDLLREEYASDE